MSWLSIITWVVASACVTLALMHVGIWWRDRSARGNLGFALVATGVALFGLCELGLMRAATTQDFATILRWIHVPIFMMVVGIVSFVATHFRTGRIWLAHAAWSINLVTLVVDFASPLNLDYRAITGIGHVRYLGETVSVVQGATSAWHWVGQLSFLFTAWFVVDASRAMWRNGDRRSRRGAAALGGTLTAFIAIAAGQAALVYGGLMRLPHLGAPWFLPVLVIMGYELSNEVLRAASLGHELQASEASLRESEDRMRQAAAAAQELSGRLITAQEDERRRIARELHDDLSQRLAYVAIELYALKTAATDGQAVGARFEELLAHVKALGSDVHALSHQIHPANVEQLGLVAAARGWCRDLSSQSGIAIEFVSDGTASDVRGQEALCLYRILQETTRNVVRHSGATAALVALFRAPDGLHLVVEDRGRGFEPGVSKRSGVGLGLVSMTERARALDGRVSIDTRPGKGTRVEAVVPVGESSTVAAAAASFEPPTLPPLPRGDA